MEGLPVYQLIYIYIFIIYNTVYDIEHLSHVYLLSNILSHKKVFLKVVYVPSFRNALLFDPQWTLIAGV